MARNNYFQFKQFKVIQEKAAMKVGTDGVLLGAWANVSGANNILDVGTGTGLIVLMMAQRSDAQITGIEIETLAAEEAVENAKLSPWSHRISIENIAFQQFVRQNPINFDLIISNPPFYGNNQKSKNSNLAIAKHNDLLPFTDLIKGSILILGSTGRLAVILPAIPAEIFIKIASEQGLFLTRLTKVRPYQGKQIHRFLMEFGKIPTDIQNDELTIHNEDGFNYTEEYKSLTREFYLNF